MATKIPEEKRIDELKIHASFQDKTTWTAIEIVDFDDAIKLFEAWLKDDKDAMRKLKTAGKLIIINEINGDACVKVHPIYKMAEEATIGRCDSIW